MTLRATSGFNPAAGGVAINGTTITATTGFVAPLSADGSFANRVISFTAGTQGIGASNGALHYFGGSAYMGTMQANGWFLASNIPLAWQSTTAYSQTLDLVLSRYAAKQVLISGDGTSAGQSVAFGVKTVTAIANNVATAVFTVTVPNSAQSAAFRVRIKGSAGAGGAIGANEATQDAMYEVNVTRTTGVNAVATIGAVIGQAASATVAGGNNIAVTAALSAISGAVGATNTFTVNATLVMAAGSATNHVADCMFELINAAATGVTIA